MSARCLTLTPGARLVYDGDDLVGFMMAAFASGNPNPVYHSYLWRLNISGTRQGRGYGRFAVDGPGAEARRRGLPRVTVSFHAVDHGPEASTSGSASAALVSSTTARSGPSERLTIG